MHVSLQHPHEVAVYSVIGQGHTFCILSIRETCPASEVPSRVDVYLSAEQLEMLATGLAGAIDGDAHLSIDNTVVWSATPTRTDTRILERS
uniref:Uncharacterized protein n=1 Tax=viral metagenome TaxID=1070528 RepID=A0A6M3KJ49_9ZZZZ